MLVDYGHQQSYLFITSIGNLKEFIQKVRKIFVLLILIQNLNILDIVILDNMSTQNIFHQLIKGINIPSRDDVNLIIWHINHLNYFSFFLHALNPQAVWSEETTRP